MLLMITAAFVKPLINDNPPHNSSSFNSFNAVVKEASPPPSPPLSERGEKSLTHKLGSQDAKVPSQSPHTLNLIRVSPRRGIVLGGVGTRVE